MMKLAVLGNVTAAREVLDALLKKGKNFAADVFVARAQYGDEVDCIDKVFSVQNVNEAKPENYDLALFIGDKKLAKDHIHQWLKAKIKVINATEALNDCDNIPYLIDFYAKSDHPAVINLPHLLSFPLLKALQPLQDYKLKHINVTQLIGADIAGQDGMSELYNHTRRILMNEAPSGKSIFPKTLAFNVIPQAGAFIGEETEYEWQLNVDLKRILPSSPKVQAYCGIIPVFIGQGAFINVAFEHKISPEDALAQWKKTKGILVVDKQTDGGYVTITDAQGESEVFISRIRQDNIQRNGLSFWLVGDSAKIMAATIGDLIVNMLKKEAK